jgi:hypothetical protein
MKTYSNFILKISFTFHVSLKTPFLFNAYIYIYIIKILGLGLKINHVTKEHDIIGGMNFSSHKLSLD